MKQSPQTTECKKRLDSGFTLIEILVVFSIISILSAIGFASFVSYSRSQQLNQTANNIKLLVSQARFNSISTVKINRDISGNTVDCSSSSLDGYSVIITGTNQIELDQECNGSTAQPIKIITLPSNLTFTSPTGGAVMCASIHFSALSATSAGLPCSIALSGYGQKKTIDIDAIGNVSIN